LPMYLSNAQYLIDRQEIFHLTDEALAVYLKMFTWPMFFIMVALTVVTSFLGAVLSTRILKKHFEKAGLL
ncbi:MAG: MptD family putative ECF transporter S component, partial [Stomatobaculum longum]|nr:MptD family putative ECF transporter S component [Stomatobaculum longum]